MDEKTSVDYMVEFQRKYPGAGTDPILRDLCITIREESIAEGLRLSNRSSGRDDAWVCSKCSQGGNKGPLCDFCKESRR